MLGTTNALATAAVVSFMIAVLAIVTPTPSAIAQPQVNVDVRGAMFQGGGGREQFTPAMTRRQLQRFNRLFDLDEPQRIVAEAFVDEYLATYDEHRRTVERIMRDAREEAVATGDFSIIQKRTQPAFAKWNEDRQRIERELLDSLRNILTDEQIDHWPRFERERRRAAMLPDARLGGENVDVTELVLGLGLESEQLASLDDVLEQYSIEMDLALQQRQRMLEPLKTAWRESIANDPERAERVWKDGTARRAMVRDLNRRYVDQIAAALGDPHGGSLREAWERAAYPLAFEPTRAERYLEAIKRLDSLSSDQVVQVNAIETEFLARLAAIRTRLIRQIIADEGSPPPYLHQIAGGEGGQVLVIRMADEGQDDPMSDLLKERFETSRTICSRLEAVLTEAQRQAVPDSDIGRNMTVQMRGARFNL